MKSNKGISIHAPHAGSDPVFSPFFAHLKISIHAPHAGSDSEMLVVFSSVAAISIHAPHAGSDVSNSAIFSPPVDFNPRSPCGERRDSPVILSRCLLFQSTLPMRGATHIAVILYIPSSFISIHAPHAGSDCDWVITKPPEITFQSTLPMRGATPTKQMHPICYTDFNPRSPCGERHRPQSAKQLNSNISIHAPHAGSDVEIL